MLTVAICTYRRFKELKRCLEHINALNDNCLIETLVVDNSLRNEESEEFRSSLGFFNKKIRYIITQKSGLSFARNIALENCQTEFIAYIDDDAYVHPGWADAIFQAFQDFGEIVGIVGGKALPLYQTPKPDWLRGDLVNPLGILDLGDQCRKLNPEEWLIGANVAYRAELLRFIGGFNENLGRNKNVLLCHEELDVNKKISNIGFSSVYNGNAVVTHLVQSERLKQEWHCKNAFWEGVSRYIIDHGIDSRELTDLTYKNLAAKCDNLLKNRQDKETYLDINNDLLVFAEEARQSLGNLSDQNYSLNVLLESNTRKKKSSNYPCLFIVTPSFNSEKTIEQTLMSVFSQSGNFYIRYHVQDGGSTDQTTAILKKWKKFIEQHVLFQEMNRGILFTYAVEQDNGVYDAISKGFSKMDIPFTAPMGWINADDVYMPNCFANVIAAFRLESVVWISGTQNVVNENFQTNWYSSHAIPTEFLKTGLCDGIHWPNVQQEGTFWKKWLWDKVDGLNANLKYVGDWDLWRRFAQHMPLVQFPFATGAFAIRGGQLSQEENNYNEEMNGIVPETKRTKTFRNIMEKRTPLQCWRISLNDSKFSSYAKHLSVLDVPEAMKATFENYFSQPAESNKHLEYTDSTNNKNVSNKMGLKFIFRFLKSVPTLPKRILEYKRLKSSRLFFHQYYLDTNPDVSNAGINPLWHYVSNGYKEAGRNPNPYFDGTWYSGTYPDVAETGLNPLIHYFYHGWKEGRNPCEYFSTKDYLNENPDVKTAKICPLVHYLNNGIIEKRKINSLT